MDRGWIEDGRGAYILDDHDKERELDAQGLVGLLGARNIRRANVGACAHRERHEEADWLKEEAHVQLTVPGLGLTPPPPPLPIRPFL